MAQKRKLVELEEATAQRFTELRERFEKKKMQAPSFTAMANRAIRKGLAAVTEELVAELK